jgi:hypothetical protein
MIYERYTTSMSGGMVQYGYTFKEQEGDDDTYLDLPIETCSAHLLTDAKMEAEYLAFEKYAKAICEQGPP